MTELLEAILHLREVIQCLKIWSNYTSYREKLTDEIVQKCMKRFDVNQHFFVLMIWLLYTLYTECDSSDHPVSVVVGVVNFYFFNFFFQTVSGRLSG